jgi:dCTP diphosphatase
MHHAAQPGLKDVQALITKFCDDRDWDQFHNPKDLSISLLLEAAEVMEHFQWKNLEEVAAYAVLNKADIGEEIADVLWFLLLLANKLDVDLTDVLEQKLQKNGRRYPVDKAKSNHKKYTELANQ